MRRIGRRVWQHAQHDHAHIVVGPVLVQADRLGKQRVGDVLRGGFLLFQQGFQQGADIQLSP